MSLIVENAGDNSEASRERHFAGTCTDQRLPSQKKFEPV
jgi:hypothetical protein